MKALQGLGSMRFAHGLQLKRQLNYTKCLVPDFVSNAQNWALKKRKLGSILDTALSKELLSRPCIQHLILF